MKIWRLLFMVFFLLQTGQDVAMATKEVYMVLMGDETAVKYAETIASVQETGGKLHTNSKEVEIYRAHLVDQHDALLAEAMEEQSYKKLYSYTHTVNGFAAHLTPEQAEKLRKMQQVKQVEKDWLMQTFTTHTPEFLGLDSGVWDLGTVSENAGEGIVIGIIDTGIDPSHPSFSASAVKSDAQSLPVFRGKCEDHEGINPFCNGKIVSARHFAEAAIASGNFNASTDFDSPLDGDGHGSHTASIAAGNHGVDVVVNGVNFGKASGMAPRARIAVYKALYRRFGGFVSDVVAAVDQAVRDGVDVLNLSVGPNTPPSSRSATFLNIFDLALLTAVKAGVFVAQAAGNGGPYPRTVMSFGPWITSVAAGLDDRSYPNWVQLGNSKSLRGIGLAPPTVGNGMYKLILARDVTVNASNFYFSPDDCQDSTLFDRAAVEGNILVCTYSFSFIFGGATMRQVAATVSNLNAEGFVMVVESDLAGSKFDPIPTSVSGIVLTSRNESREFLDYYDAVTVRDFDGKVSSFNAIARIGNGQRAVFNASSAPMVALFSSRGPDFRSFAFQDADVLKPDILAPGSLIWGAWTPLGIDEPNFQGKKFAMVSGTSMATPHIAGIAALIKCKYPSLSPAAIASAMVSTASVTDKTGRPLLAQRLSQFGGSMLTPANPFDFGGGAINPVAAMDPGLVFDAGYEDYIDFLCNVPGMDPDSVFNATSMSCSNNRGQTTDLNLASITIANLIESRRVPRTVKNIAAATEIYSVSFIEPEGVRIKVSPKVFSIKAGESFPFVVQLQATNDSDVFSFGSIQLSGDRGHRIRMPVSVLKKRTSTPPFLSSPSPSPLPSPWP